MLNLIEITEQQHLIIESQEPVIQVQAFAGTGKTTVIELCVSQAIAHGVKPPTILCLTFSNSARDTLRKRLPAGVKSATVHASALTFATGNRNAPAVLSQSEAQALLKAAVKHVQKKRRAVGASRSEFLDAARGNTANLRLVAHFFEVIQAGNRSPRRVAADTSLPFAVFAPRLSLLKRVFRRYRKLKDKAGRMDFADMIRLGTDAVRRATSIGFTHLFVDEYQDSGSAQAHFIAALGRRMRRVRVFGDRFQAIYGFAGARFTDLTSLLPGTKTFPLTLSFRFTHQTAALASAVVAQRYPGLQPIVGDRGAGPVPQLIECSHAYQQDDAVLKIIRDLTSTGVSLGQITILAHTRAQLREQEHSLLARDIGTQPLYRERGTEHALAVARLVGKLERLKDGSEHGIRAKLRSTLGELVEGRDVKTNTKEAHRRALENAIRNQSLQARYKACAAAYLSMRGLVKVKHGLDAVAEVNHWQAKAGAFASADELKRAIRKLTASEKVFTNTVHQAKGGEWDHIIVLNVVDGCMPFFRSGTGDTALDEGRNLFYVAVTRARRRVYLVQAPYSNAKARQEFSAPSPFTSDEATRRCLDVRPLGRVRLPRRMAGPIKR